MFPSFLLPLQAKRNLQQQVPGATASGETVPPANPGVAVAQPQEFHGGKTPTPTKRDPEQMEENQYFTGSQEYSYLPPLPPRFDS